MSRVAIPFVFLASAVAACSSAQGTSSHADSCVGAGCPSATAQCPEGFSRDASIGACVDVSPKEECPPGTGAFLGNASCEPVGWTSCEPPFENDPSGWGCRMRLAAECPAGTVPEIGNASCKAIADDCSKPFPPKDATLFVDASFTKTDSTHLTTLFDAALKARKGDVVAVAPGTYVEDIDVISSDVTIVGKCARDVIIENPGDRRAGVLVMQGARNVRVSGLTLKGHYSGILVKAGSQATLEDSIIVDSRWMGVYSAEKSSSLKVARTYIRDVRLDDVGKFGWGAAAQLGGHLELEDVVIDRPTSTGLVVGGAGSTARVSRIAVRSPQTKKDGFGTGVGVVDSGKLEVDGAWFDDSTRVGLMVSGGTATMRNVVVTKTHGAADARGVQVTKGGSLELDRALVSDTDGDANVMVLEGGSRLKMTSSVVRGELAGDGSHGGMGIRVGLAASSELADTAIVANVRSGLAVQDPGTLVKATHLLATDTRTKSGARAEAAIGFGVGVAWGGALELSRSSVTNNRASGVLVSEADDSGTPASADIVSTLVRRTHPDSEGRFGRGVEVSRSGKLTMTASAIAENHEVSLNVGGTGSTATIRRTIVRDTSKTGDVFGLGASVSDDGALALEDAWLVGHSGVGIVVAGAHATVARSLVARSTVGIHVQSGSSLLEADDATVMPDRNACLVSKDSQFIDNRTKVGSGELPIPPSVDEVPRAIDAAKTP